MPLPEFCVTTHMTHQPVTPRPAATLILVRDASHGLEVLLAKRTHLADFAGGAYVFPGGAVDSADHAPELAALASGIDDVEASKRLGVKHGGIGYWIAAIRECFEECGVLMTEASLSALTPSSDAMQKGRNDLNAGRVSFEQLLNTWDQRPDASRLHLVARWITPLGSPVVPLV